MTYIAGAGPVVLVVAASASCLLGAVDRRHDVNRPARPMLRKQGFEIAINGQTPRLTYASPLVGRAGGRSLQRHDAGFSRGVATAIRAAGSPGHRRNSADGITRVAARQIGYPRIVSSPIEDRAWWDAAVNAFEISATRFGRAGSHRRFPYRQTSADEVANAVDAEHNRVGTGSRSPDRRVNTSTMR